MNIAPAVQLPVFWASNDQQLTNIMKLNAIYTDRAYQQWPSWDIVYEWENELAVNLNLPIRPTPFHNNGIEIVVGKIWRRLFNSDLSGGIFGDKEIKEPSIYFEMNPKKFRSFSNNGKVMPIIIDWGIEKVDDFHKYYHRCPIVLISSLEAMKFLQQNNCNLNLIHFPLSLPDKYFLKPGVVIPKQYDIVLAGRKSPVLWEYLKAYEKEHPSIEYVYQQHSNGQLNYHSNKTGMIGNFQRRDDYFKLLFSAKVGFYSTLGIDGGEKRNGGFNPVTPRFLELLAAGCHVIARYPGNADTDFYQLDSIAPSIVNYEQFERQLDNALASSQPIERNANYLLDHYTSKRSKILRNILSNIK